MFLRLLLDFFIMLIMKNIFILRSKILVKCSDITSSFPEIIKPEIFWYTTNNNCVYFIILCIKTKK